MHLNQKKIYNLERRMQAIEETLAEAAGGDLSSRVPINLDDADDFTSIETGINLILSDLEDEVACKEELEAELNRLRNNKT